MNSIRKNRSGICLALPEEAVRTRFRNIDLVVADLDECIYPGITKIALLKNLCFLLARKGKIRDIVRLLRIISFFPLLLALRLSQLCGIGIDNRLLIVVFIRMLNGVPISFLEKAAEGIPAGSAKGCAETLAMLEKKSPTGIISQSLDVVLEAYARAFTRKGKPVISFYDGNGLLLEEKKGIKVVSGPRMNNAVLTPGDKEARARQRMKEFQSLRPLAIGHGAEDVSMMRLASEAGGLAVGVNPCPEAKKVCDIAFRNKDWEQIRNYFLLLAGENRERPGASGRISRPSGG